jgi:hypothetical protein
LFDGCIAFTGGFDYILFRDGSTPLMLVLVFVRKEPQTHYNLETISNCSPRQAAVSVGFHAASISLMKRLDHYCTAQGMFLFVGVFAGDCASSFLVFSSS